MLTENGEFTDKYYQTKQLFLREMVPLGIKIPDPPDSILTIAYPAVKIMEKMTWNKLIENVVSVDKTKFLIQSSIYRNQQKLFLV